MNNIEKKHINAAKEWLNNPNVSISKSYKVIKRKKASKLILETLGITGVMVLIAGMTIYGVHGYIKEREIEDRQLAAYKAKYYVDYVSEEDKEAANKRYVESFYSGETINDLNSSILKDYSNLIDMIKNNNIDNEINIIDEYNKFKEQVQQDKVNYLIVDESIRLEKAMNLYNIRLNIYKKQKQILQTNFDKGLVNTEERSNLSDKIELINTKINDITHKLNSVGEVNMSRGSNQR